MPPRRRRSCLTVPGDDEHKLVKAAGLEVDEVILEFDGAARLDGEMVDAASRRMAEAILARNPPQP